MPKPKPHGILVQKPQYNEFCRVWVKVLGLDELSNGLHVDEEQTDKNKAIIVKRPLSEETWDIIYDYRSLH